VYKMQSRRRETINKAAGRAQSAAGPNEKINLIQEKGLSALFSDHGGIKKERARHKRGFCSGDGPRR
jgi:hypothetical protein